MTEPLKSNRVIVDRTVMVDIMRSLEHWGEFEMDDAEHLRLHELRKEFESGQRVELYERDWPTSE